MSSAARYHARAPRYVFRPDDQSLMRFAGIDTRGSASHAHVHDLSASGLSFVVDSSAAPRAGDMLKIEFGIPGKRQMAWFATVVRVEQRSEWDPHSGESSFTLVGLRFRQLPAPFRKAIEASVQGKVHSDPEGATDIVIGKELQTSDHTEEDVEVEDTRGMVMFMALSVALLLSFYVMALPVEAVVRLPAFLVQSARTGP